MSARKKKDVQVLGGTKTGPVFVPLSLQIVSCPDCSARVVRVEIEHFNEDGHHYESVLATVEPGGELAIYDDEPGIWRPRHPCGSAMPRLSLDLEHQRHPSYCQACGKRGEAARQLMRWEEHDEQDQVEPERHVVMLCQACAKKIIDPHPRLYRELELYEAHPGSMDICIQCVHRRGVSCLKARNGQAPAMKQKATTVFFDGRAGPKGGRRAGWSERLNFEWPDCAERRDGNP